MSLDLITREVKDLLATTIDDVKQARITLRSGAAAERVQAAGEIQFLRRRELILRSRLTELRHTRDGWLREFSEWMREQGLLLRLGFEHWLAH
jgi:hypothetical protein